MVFNRTVCDYNNFNSNLINMINNKDYATNSYILDS